MDPLSVAASVMGVAGGCLAICRTLNTLTDKFTDAAITISAICTQSSLIAAALAQVQNILLRDPDGIARQLDNRPELSAALDTALTSCVVVLSCIDREIKKLGLEEGEEIGFTAKARWLWQEPVMKEMLEQLKGQATAFTFLLQCFQLESLNDIQRLLRSNDTVMNRVKQGSQSLRESNPLVSFPESILESTRTSIDAFGENASLIGAEEFVFDEELINTRAYRRAMAFARGKARVERSIRGKREKTLQANNLAAPRMDDDNASIATTLAPISSWAMRKKLSFSLVRLKGFGRQSRPQSVISEPTTFLHVTHVHFNPDTGEFEGLPDDWKTLMFPHGYMEHQNSVNHETSPHEDLPAHTREISDGKLENVTQSPEETLKNRVELDEDFPPKIVVEG